MYDNYYLIFTSIGLVIIITIVSSAGIIMSKYWGTVVRASVWQSRMAVVWVVSLALGWEEFIWLECIAFLVFIIPGSLIYNDIVVMKCLKEKSVLEETLI